MSFKQNIRNLSEKILDYSRNNIISVVLRHSIREEISDKASIRGALLTNEGKKLAYEFGTLLPKDRFIRIFHSPISRCKETAESIYEGILNNDGSCSIIGEQNFLAGAYVYEREAFINILFGLSGSEFINEWFKGRINRNILEPPTMARYGILKYLFQSNQKNINEIDIHISHDLNLILLKSFLLDVLSKDFRWPDYMEGVIFKRDEKKMILCVEDKEKIISID